MHFVCAIVHTSLVEGLRVSICLIGCYISGIFFAYLFMYETNLIIFTFYAAVQYTTCTRSAATYTG